MRLHQALAVYTLVQSFGILLQIVVGHIRHLGPIVKSLQGTHVPLWLP